MQEPCCQCHVLQKPTPISFTGVQDSFLFLAVDCPWCRLHNVRKQFQNDQVQDQTVTSNERPCLGSQLNVQSTNKIENICFLINGTTNYYYTISHKKCLFEQISNEIRWVVVGFRSVPTNEKNNHANIFRA